MAKRMKEKAAAREKAKDNRPRAIVKYVRMSPFKVREVLDVIRDKDYYEASAILANTPRSAATVVKKVLDSAAANAENNLSLSKSDLFVAEIFADAGPTLKRMQPMDHGKAYTILKRTTHITVVLDVKAK